MSGIRKKPLANNCVYHILNKSIAGYEIFSNTEDCDRMLNVIQFYSYDNLEMKFSDYTRLINHNEYKFNEDEKLVQIMAYCIMPTHFHLILKQLKNNGISIYVGRLLNSYSRYFNIKYNRKGPLWVGRYKNVLVEDDSQLLHLTRYIHLNPVTSQIVDNPEDWEFSSYKEYLKSRSIKICKFNDIIDIDSKKYIKFVTQRSSYQRDLHLIKKIIID